MMVPLLSLPVSLDPICRLLASGRFDLTTEKAAQVDIHGLLIAMLPPGFDVEREARLSAGDIPDFLIAGQVVVEIKISRSSNVDTLRQLVRYAAHDKVRSLILASNRAVGVPREINGKPARFVSLGRAWL